jgi:hypothetical protein
MPHLELKQRVFFYHACAPNLREMMKERNIRVATHLQEATTLVSKQRIGSRDGVTLK